MTIEQDILKAETPAYVELFEIDLTTTNIPELALQKLYLTPTVTSAYTEVTFGGHIYSAYPIQIEGISQSAEGAPPRPSLAIANISKYFGALSFQYNDIIGASVRYIRTFAPYLGSGSSFSLPPLKFTISRKLSHNKMGIVFELRSPQDKERAYLPKRQMLRKDFPGLGVNKRV